MPATSEELTFEILRNALQAIRDRGYYPDLLIGGPVRSRFEEPYRAESSLRKRFIGLNSTDEEIDQNNEGF